MRVTRFRLLLSIFFIFQLYIVAGKNYYISNSGNDNSNGTSTSTPWKTISKVNSSIQLFQAGDSILFRRGDQFFGQITWNKSGGSTSPIVIGGYGLGSKPLISGAQLLKGWSRYSGKIFSLAMTDAVKNLFIDANPMVLARYPNSGWLFTTSGNGTYGFTDDNLFQSDGYWNGASVHIRSINWAYEIRNVSNYAGKSVVFDRALIYSIKPNFGFFFDNLYSELDSVSEWYYSSSDKKLYFVPLIDDNPDNSNVYGTVYDYGIKMDWNVSNIIIRDLSFNKQAKAGIWFGGTSANVTIIQNDFDNCQSGIEMNGNPMVSVLIKNNLITNCTGRGIYFYSAETSNILYNYVKNAGLKDGYGIDGVNNGTGICVTGYSKSTNITGNYIENTGYIGIRCDGQYINTTNNIVKNTMLTLADGGAIYCWGTITVGSTIKDNYIEKVTGNNLTCPDLSGLPMGIYLDDKSGIVNIQGNTVVKTNGPGIFIHNSGGNTIDGNTVFNSQGLTFAEDMAGSSVGNIVKNNVFYSLSEVNIPLVINSASSTPDLGMYSNNYYCNPYNPNVVYYRDLNYTPYNYGLNHWKNATGQDLDSKESLFYTTADTATATLGNNLVVNPNFNNNIASWQVWPTNNSIIWTQNSKLNNGCLKLTTASSDPNTNNTVYTNNFSLEKDKYYEFSFSIVGTLFASLHVQSLDASYPQVYYPIQPDFRTDYVTIFKTSSVQTDVRLNFLTNNGVGSYYLDNVSLLQIGAQNSNPEEKSLIFSNPSGITTRFDLQEAVFNDLDGNQVTDYIDIQPWRSKILVHISGVYHKPSSVETISSVSFSVFPNPNQFGQTTNLSLNLDKVPGEISISIYDINGNTLLIKNINPLEKTTNLNTSNLPRGIYFISLKGNSFSSVEKLIII
jgi:parallel beta-helix repeat protein